MPAQEGRRVDITDRFAGGRFTRDAGHGHRLTAFAPEVQRAGGDEAAGIFSRRGQRTVLMEAAVVKILEPVGQKVHVVFGGRTELPGMVGGRDHSAQAEHALVDLHAIRAAKNGGIPLGKGGDQ